jgi:HAD superfamily hydrolase (TIGR01509 family)
MIRTELTAVLCDVGDVLIKFDKSIQGRIEQRFGVRPGLVREVLLRSEVTRLASVGQVSHEEWLAEVSKDLPSAAVAEWLDDHGVVNADLVDFLTAAKKRGLRLFFLSNATSRLWGDLDFHGLRELADGIYCSASIGVAKPDPRAYKFVIEETRLAPGTTVYIDDTASWVHAGEREGLLGYVYGTTSGLRDFLIAKGFVA